MMNRSESFPFSRGFYSDALVLITFVFFVLSCAVPSISLAEDDDATSAAEDIAAWAQVKEANGPEGRPLPLTASWVPGGMFGMPTMVEMIKEGHHVLPTISDPKFGAIYHYILANADGPPTADSHHLGWLPKLKPEFKYLAEHKLPFALMGNNWAAGVVGLERQYQRKANKHNRRTFSPGKSSRLMVEREGEITSGSWKLASPFAPDERWKEFARWWMDNGGLRWIRDIYPDPPMVVFLNNNEAGEIGLKHLNRSLRFQKKYGDRDLDKRKSRKSCMRPTTINTTCFSKPPAKR